MHTQSIRKNFSRLSQLAVRFIGVEPIHALLSRKRLPPRSSATNGALDCSLKLKIATRIDIHTKNSGKMIASKSSRELERCIRSCWKSEAHMVRASQCRSLRDTAALPPKEDEKWSVLLPALLSIIGLLRRDISFS